MSDSYFDGNSAFDRCDGNDRKIIDLIANRYIEANPPAKPIFRAYEANQCRREPDARYRICVTRSEKMIARSSLMREGAGQMPLAIGGSGPYELFVNGISAARGSGERNTIAIDLASGLNTLLFTVSAPDGQLSNIVGTIGVVAPYRDLRFLMPGADRQGREGWIWTSATADADPRSFIGDPDFAGTDDKIRWFPENAPSFLREGNMRALFGHRPGLVAGARSSIVISADEEIALTLSTKSPCALFINGVIAYETDTTVDAVIRLRLTAGAHDIRALSTCPRDSATDWIVAFSLGAGSARFVPIEPIEGYRSGWTYLGPFSEGTVDPSALDRFDEPTRTEEGLSYWRLDGNNLRLRPYLESPLFGQWNYPLGVTLYGLLEAGIFLNQEETVNYVQAHVSVATKYAALSSWDFETFGATAMNRQLARFDLLDNCGSFGSLMLEANTRGEIPNAREIAERIARFMAVEHERLDDGAFYRAHHHVQSIVGTLWADDLYMCVPFLLRFYRLTGEETYLSDAIRQIERYAERLFRPEQGIFNHVYDVVREKPNGIPWGRGNGWAFFSLAELLTFLPPTHESRARLTDLFIRAAHGFLVLQDFDGRWHQVLTDPSSFPETSCTAMFAYGFARGVILGALPREPFAEAAFRAWKGIAQRSVDDGGNVYGVCQGSGFSFDESYYRDGLTWILNDAHGTGIVLLAAVEVARIDTEPRTHLQCQ